MAESDDAGRRIDSKNLRRWERDRVRAFRGAGGKGAQRLRRIAVGRADLKHTAGSFIVTGVEPPEDLNMAEAIQSLQGGTIRLFQ